MKSHSVRLMPLALACGLPCIAFAGEPKTTPPPIESASVLDDLDFIAWLSERSATLYKNPESPWLSKITINGRFHWQAAHVDGEGNNGQEFSDSYIDTRRFRIGAKVDFLNYFTYAGSLNLVEDKRFNGGELHYGYQDFDQSNISFDALRAFNLSGVDVLSITYGRLKWHGGLEARASSNDGLLTIERSAISNKVHVGYRPTGLRVNAAKGALDTTFGIYSSDEAIKAGSADGADETGADGNVEGWGSWNDGLMFTAEVLYSARNDLRLGWELLYNNADEIGANQDSLLDYRWATTFSAEYTIGNGGVNVEGFYGDNGGSEMHSARNAARRGNFWGFVATPYYWIIPAKLQAVGQYSYAGSEEDQGIRTNSRYLRASKVGGGGNPDVVNRGRGKELHSFYAGLNYLIRGDNLKVQLGVGYDMLSTPGQGNQDVDALTYLVGFRSFF